jgi:Big-like domain-containing protein
MSFRLPQFRRNRSLPAAALLVCALGLTGCGAAGGGQAAPAVTLKSIEVSPSTSAVLLGSSQKFTVTGHYSDGSQRDLTQTVSWSVQPTIATISTPGLAVAKKPGTATITAASGSVNGSATLNISTPTLVSLAVAPSSQFTPKGNTQQFTATGTFSDQSTQDLTDIVLWTTSAAKVASIGSGGMATAETVGTATISATSSDISAAATLTVTPPVLTSLALTPVNSSVGLGNNEQLNATGTFSDGSSQDLTRSVAWATGKPAVATITANGLATTWSLGTTRITATIQSFTEAGNIAVLPVAAVDYFSYANNVNAPDTTLTLVNSGLTGGDLCAMVYVFDNSQEMNECCGCSISKDGIKTLSVNNDLTSNTLTGILLNTGVIRMIPADAASNPTCNAGAVTPSGLISSWTSHIQTPLPDTYAITEAESQMPTLSKAELTDLQSDCAFIQKLGSGHGVCTCGVGD